MDNDPARNCQICRRLAEFRRENSEAHPDWHNAPVPSFGPMDARLLVVGLAPGLRGANRTGRPFTGDFAGDLLYKTLRRFGYTRGAYDRRPDDGLTLVGCRITNAVRCVPPQNRPLGAEVAACRQYLAREIAALPRLRIILALGVLSHGAIIAAFGLRQSMYRFAHGALHDLPNGLVLADSYHCSRYNTNTGRLSEDMFAAVFAAVSKCLTP